MDTSVCSFGHCHSSESGLGALRPPGRSQQVTVGKQVLHSITEKVKRGGAWPNSYTWLCKAGGWCTGKPQLLTQTAKD